MRLTAIMMIVGLTAAAHGQPSEQSPPRTYVNLRAGSTVAGNAGFRTRICGEAEPFRKFAIEACGAGGGLLHSEDIPDMFLLHIKYTVYERALGAGLLRLTPGVGMSELELGGDGLGFTFGPPGPNARSVAGPSLSVSAAWVRPMGKGIEFMSQVTFATAWMHYAPQLISPQDRFQPSLGLSVGIGY